MKTRFDGGMWITANGVMCRPEELETDHLLNIVKMLKNKPNITVNMVIRDIESAPDSCPFSPFGNGHADLVKESLFNVTSMTPAQLATFALTSPLGCAIRTELIRRGVNVENYLSMVEIPETI